MAMSKRLFVVLSLCLLLQQFAPAYAANLSKDKHSKKSHKAKHHDNDEDQEVHQSAEKKGFVSGLKKVGTALKKGWKLLGEDAIIKKINLVTEVTGAITAVVNLGLTIATAIGGCGALAPELTKNWEAYEKLNEEFRVLSNKIDALNLQAVSRQEFINSTFYEYRRTRDRLEDIADEKERIYESFGPETVIAAKNTTHDMMKLIEKKNATGEEVSDIQVSLGYTKGLDLALNLLFPSLSLSFSGAKLLWKVYLKDTVIGKKISGLPEAFKNKIKSDPKSKKSKKVSSGRIMNTRFGKRLQAIGDSVKPKLVKAAKFAKSFLKRFAPVAGLASSAFDIWAIFNTVKNCQDMGKKSKESVSKMEELIEITKEILQNVTEGNDAVQSGYDEVHGYIFNEILLDAVTQLKAMMENPEVAKKTDESDGIVDAIQAFLTAKDLDVINDNNKIKVDNVHRDLNAALFSIPFTLKCFTEKGDTFNDVKTECSTGQGSLATVYETVKRLKENKETESKCGDRTGPLYASLADMKAAWEKWATDDGNYDTLCLMNNANVKKGVLDQMRKGIKDPQQVANNIYKPDEVEEITAMMEKLKDDPSLKVLPKFLQSMICAAKGRQQSAAEAVEEISGFGLGTISIEDFNNQECPPPSADETDDKD